MNNFGKGPLGISERLASQFIRATQPPHPPPPSKRRHSESSDHDEYRDHREIRDERFLPGGYLAAYDDKTIDYIARRNLEEEDELAGKDPRILALQQTVPEAYLVQPHRKRRTGFHNSPTQNMPFVPFYFPQRDRLANLGMIISNILET